MRVFDQTIEKIVEENFLYARALQYLGVDFFLCPDKQLKEVCKEMNLSQSKVIRAFHLFDQSPRFSFKALADYPLELVIEYLKYTHHHFIKERLPFISNLISKLPGHHDLKLIFPTFTEDFIHHIYEEEDLLFSYVQHMLRQHKLRHKHILTFNRLEEFSLEDHYTEHCKEDELMGLRQLTEDWNPSDIHGKVIVKEIQAFDREMWYHAEIENQIFFPRAIELEKKVSEQILHLALLN